MRSNFFVFISILVLANFCAGNVTQIEKKIVEETNKSVPDAIALLEKVVNINSGTMNHEGVQKVGEIFKNEFQKIGFQTKWISMKEVNRSGHLFAERAGNQGKRLLLIGHLDTVFEMDQPFQRFERRGSRAVGQGVNDMKGGDVIVLFALKALHDLGLLENTRIVVVFTGDEENAGDPVEVSRRDLIDAARRSDVALGYESSEGLNTATIARRGFSSWRLSVSAEPGHSSDIFSEKGGNGAIFETARIFHLFYEQLAGEKYLTFNPGVVVGGTEVSFEPEHSRGKAFGKTNVIAKSVVAEGDLRFISQEQKEAARKRMRNIVQQNLPKTSAKIEFSEGYPAMTPTEGNRKLLQMLDKVSKDLGYQAIEPFDPGKRGAADISFVAGFLDCLDGLGAMGKWGHTAQEDIDLSSLPLLIQRSAILIYRLTRP